MVYLVGLGAAAYMQAMLFLKINPQAWHMTFFVQVREQNIKTLYKKRHHKDFLKLIT